MPHSGTALPEQHAEGFSDTAFELADTDWHIPRLYDFAGELGANIIAANISRYVVDLNRPPDNAELYPGANGTQLCPTTNFAEEDLYRPGMVPTTAEVDRRVSQYWQPYHDRISTELMRLRAQFGVAVLFDAHSIRSQVPRLFEGKLPDLNLGTAGGETAAASLLDTAKAVLQGGTFYVVANQRFKGGYITRCYGRPEAGIHALQLELCQDLYMEEKAPFGYLEQRAVKLQPLLRDLLSALIEWANRETTRR